MSRPTITLTTDFSPGSSSIAEMKGVLLSLAGEVRIVDLAHSIRPHDVRQAAVTIAEVSRMFPEGTIHVAVVDPGGGTERKLVAAQFGSQRYLAPDNGLLSLLALQATADQLVSIENRSLFRTPLSQTFHGRDILCPAAAHLAKGHPLEDLGPALPEIERLDWPKVIIEPKQVTGVVQSVDSFGNLISNIDEELISEALQSETISVSAGNHPTRSIARSYGNFEAGRLVALVGSHGRVELSIVGGNASQQLEIGPGAPFVVQW